MKKIVRRVPAHTVRSFQCEVCGTKYPTKNQAKKCEARIKEKKVFKLGDKVRGIEPHVCSDGPTDLNFRVVGVVVDILGPMHPDYEYEVKWLGGKRERLHGHVYLYEVAYLCVCNRKRANLYRTPELVRVRSKNR